MNRGVFFVTVATMAALSPPTVKTDCIPEGSYVSTTLIPFVFMNLWKIPLMYHQWYVQSVFVFFQCMDSIKPCCRLNALRDGRIRHDEYICFIFGQGLCQPFHAIPQIRLYVQLVQQLNETNYMELRRQYRMTLDRDATADLEDSYILPSKANAFVQQLYHGIAT